MIIEENIKSDFNVCSDEKNNIHIVTINKKYELIYSYFDGEDFRKEILYEFDSEVGIPSGPIIEVNGDLVLIIVTFIRINIKKKWSIRGYIKLKNKWDYEIIDKGLGLCYNQPSISIDNIGNMHLIYRYIDNYSILKYSIFDKNNCTWEKTKNILDNGINKYRPLIFINNSNIINVCWIEIKTCEVYLCYAKNVLNTDDYFKLNITEDIYDMSIYFDTEHVFCVFNSKKELNFDLCCNKNIYLDLKIERMVKMNCNMNKSIRTYLDIIREYEDQLNVLKNDKLKECKTLSEENDKLKQCIDEKDKQIFKLQLELDNLKNILEEKDNIILENQIVLERISNNNGFIKRILELINLKQ